MIHNLEEKYSGGALLYSPALNTKVANAVINNKFGNRYSLAFCLEDTIADNSVELAEQQLKTTLKNIYLAKEKTDFFLPKIFIRVRSSEQVIRLYNDYQPYSDILSGFIAPKYTVSNADEYNKAIISINSKSSKILFLMPILESKDIVDYTTRYATLSELKQKVDSVKEYVLNVRVGGNDISNEFATRRHYDETIYDILPVAQLLGDILTAFSREYVVSGPVWEYFSSVNEEWKRGLQNELKLDILNGFIGKTVIHPKQISVVNEALKVSQKDYEDAKEILNWEECPLQVGKSFAGERMNEAKTHYNWAYKTITLANIYGIV